MGYASDYDASYDLMSLELRELIEVIQIVGSEVRAVCDAS
jgi:hypothetical protein